MCEMKNNFIEFLLEKCGIKISYGIYIDQNTIFSDGNSIEFFKNNIFGLPAKKYEETDSPLVIRLKNGNSAVISITIEGVGFKKCISYSLAIQS